MIQLRNNRFSLLLTPDMRRLASARAKQGKVSLCEWIRRAMEAKLAGADTTDGACTCQTCIDHR